MSGVQESTIAARIPTDLRDALELLAARDDVDLSTIIRRGLRTYSNVRLAGPGPTRDTPRPTLAAAQAEAEEAIAKVEANASAEWRAAALDAVRETALVRFTFIAADVWELGDLEPPRESRAMGPVMRAAARAGYCERTTDTRPSPLSHGAPMPVWRSLLYTDARARAAGQTTIDEHLDETEAAA